MLQHFSAYLAPWGVWTPTAFIKWDIFKVVWKFWRILSGKFNMCTDLSKMSEEECQGSIFFIIQTLTSLFSAFWAQRDALEMQMKNILFSLLNEHDTWWCGEWNMIKLLIRRIHWLHRVGHNKTCRQAERVGEVCNNQWSYFRMSNYRLSK